jgi:hypothetical protein
LVDNKKPTQTQTVQTLPQIVTMVRSLVVSVAALLIVFFSAVGYGQDAHAPGLGASVQQNIADRGECTVLGDDNALCTDDYSSRVGKAGMEGNGDYTGAVDDDDDDDDPMLEKMPGIDFKAYKRADISSFYQEPPGSRVETTPSFNGQPAKFQNMGTERLDLYWDAGSGPTNARAICQTGPFESCGTSSFPGHVFFFLRPKTQEVACSFRVTKDYANYYCDPFVPNAADDPTAGVYTGRVRSLDELNDRQKKLYEAASFNRAFAPLYKNFTGGSDWLGNFPTKKPAHFMWPAGTNSYCVGCVSFADQCGRQTAIGFSKCITDSIFLPTTLWFHFTSFT